MWNRSGETVRGRSNREFAVRLCLLGMSETIPMPHQHVCLNMSSMRTTYLLTWMKETPQVFNPTRRTIDNWGELRTGKMVCSSEDIPTGYLIPNGQPWEHTYILSRLSSHIYVCVHVRAHMCMYVCIYMFVCTCIATVNEKRGHGFEKEQWRKYGRVQREEEEGGYGAVSNNERSSLKTSKWQHRLV